MKKMTNKKGFTLAELLIVVAIIAVLVAIAIPVFTAQLHRSKDTTDIANARAMYAELQSDYILNQNTTNKATIQGKYTFSNGTVAITDPTGDKGYVVVWTCKDNSAHTWTSETVYTAS